MQVGVLDKNSLNFYLSEIHICPVFSFANSGHPVAQTCIFVSQERWDSQAPSTSQGGNLATGVPCAPQIDPACFTSERRTLQRCVCVYVWGTCGGYSIHV